MKRLYITDDKEIEKILIDFFSNIIPHTKHSDLKVENVRDPTLKAILKYRNHPSI